MLRATISWCLVVLCISGALADGTNLQQQVNNVCGAYNALSSVNSISSVLNSIGASNVQQYVCNSNGAGCNTNCTSSNSDLPYLIVCSMFAKSCNINTPVTQNNQLVTYFSAIFNNITAVFPPFQQVINNPFMCYVAEEACCITSQVNNWGGLSQVVGQVFAGINMIPGGSSVSNALQGAVQNTVGNAVNNAVQTNVVQPAQNAVQTNVVKPVQNFIGNIFGG